MGTQTRSGSGAPDKLNNYAWISPQRAANAALRQFPIMEKLRNGQNLLSVEQFADNLATGNLEILALPYDSAVLMCWNDSKDGRVFNVITCAGDFSKMEELYAIVEHAARSAGAGVILSVGRPGYSKALEAKGYELQKLLVMKKVLT